MSRAFSGTKMSKLGLEKTDKVFSGNKKQNPALKKIRPESLHKQKNAQKK